MAAGLAAAAAATEEDAEAGKDPSSRRRGRLPHAAHPGDAGRGAEEVLEDGHGKEHGDEDGGGHEPE